MKVTTIRQKVREAVAANAPIKASDVIESFDGELSAHQIYAALSHLTRRKELNRTSHGYYEPLDPVDRALEDDDAQDRAAPDESQSMVREFIDEFAELDERLVAPPADLVIQNAEEKIATCELLERVLAPALAARVALIRSDLERLAHL